MADPKKTQQEQEQEQPEQEQSDTQTSSTYEGPNFRTDRDEIKEASQQFFRTLFRTGVHIVMAPVYMLPEEPREHFITAGREITRGLSTLAQELADDFEKAVDQVKGEAEKVREEVKKDAGL